MTRPETAWPLPGSHRAEDLRAELGVSRETLARLQLYAGLLQRWNRSINLVGRDTLPDLWRRHFLDSAQLLSFLPPPPAERPRRLIDLGSGAGFPGLVLAILGVGEVHLVESDRRKCAFLREVARATETRVTVHPERIERLQGLQGEVVTARALAPLDRLLDYARPLLAPGGVCLFLKGRGAERELTALDGAGKMTLESFPSRSAPDSLILRIGGLPA